MDFDFSLDHYSDLPPTWSIPNIFASKICQEELGGINVCEALQNQFNYFTQCGYLFTSDSCIYLGEEYPTLEKLMSLKEPFCAFGQPPGHGLNEYEFVIYYADAGRVFMMNIPHGGAFMDNAESAQKINEAFQKLEEFILSPQNIPEGSKNGLFYKYGLGGFSPIFNIDCKTLEFRDSTSIKKE